MTRVERATTDVEALFLLLDKPIVKDPSLALLEPQLLAKHRLMYSSWDPPLSFY